ncbi:MAG: 3-phosphoshikimate 1-carboxyvinyltransferase, partial [Clostridia bacterium]|nr:3-phosphoshikimate 1-carboxyvinyltransferase [Clostridia bacterium]
MTVVINPSAASGTAIAPPSKSVAHRALICGALSDFSRIENVAFSRDISATLDCLEKMGAKVEREGSAVNIGGLDITAISDEITLDCDESGSTLRFLIPLLWLSSKSVKIIGGGRLMQRPLGIYEDIAAKNGFLFEKKDKLLLLKGALEADKYVIPGNVSSQFITGLMLALPLLKNDSKITICGDFESASYVDITISTLKAFGVNIKREENTFYICGGQKYVGASYVVEGDCSNAAYLDVFNYIGSDFKLCGVPQ